MTGARHVPSLDERRLRSVRAAWPAHAWAVDGTSRAAWNEDRYLLGVFIGLLLPLTFLGLGAFWQGRSYFPPTDPRLLAAGLTLALLALPVNALALGRFVARLTPPGRAPRGVLRVALGAATALPVFGLAAAHAWRLLAAWRPAWVLARVNPLLRLEGTGGAPARAVRRRLASWLDAGGQSLLVVGAWAVLFQTLPLAALTLALDAAASEGKTGLRVARVGLAALHGVYAAACVVATEHGVRRLGTGARGRAVARGLACTALLPFPFCLLSALPWTPLPGMPLSEERRDARALAASALRVRARIGVPAALRNAGWWRAPAAPQPAGWRGNSARSCAARRHSWASTRARWGGCWRAWACWTRPGSRRPPA